MDCVKPEKQHWTDRAMDLSRVAIVALGIAGVAAASPALIIASLAADIAYQIIEAGKANNEMNVGKFLMHCSFVVIDTLALAAFVAGSWQVMVTAAAVSAVVLIGFALSQMNPDMTGNDICRLWLYTALSLVTLWSAIDTAKLTGTFKTNSKFTYQNTTDKEIVMFDKWGHKVVTVQPGETVSFEIPFKNTLQHSSYTAIPNPNGGFPTMIPTKTGSYLQVVSFDGKEALETTKLNAFAIDKVNIVTQQPLPVKDFPTLPIGGNVIYV